MAKVSLVSGLPCFRFHMGGEQTKTSKFLRISAIALGIIALIVGYLILKNTIAVGLLSMSVGAPLVALSVLLIVPAIFFRCIKLRTENNSQLLVAPQPSSGPNPIIVAAQGKLNHLVKEMQNKNWHSIYNDIQNLSENEMEEIFPWAIRDGQLQIVQAILAKSSSYAFLTYTFQGSNYTPLYEAVAYPDSNTAFAMAQTILSYDKNNILIKEKSDDEMTALHRAISCSSLELVQLLIACKADVNAQNEEDNTPLHCLLLKPNILGVDASLFQLLVDSGANLHLPNENGITVFELVQDKEWFPQIKFKNPE